MSWTIFLVIWCSYKLSTCPSITNCTTIENKKESCRQRKDIHKCYDDFNKVTAELTDASSLAACCQFRRLESCLREPMLFCGIEDPKVETKELDSLIPQCSVYRHNSFTCLLYFYWIAIPIVLVVATCSFLVLECFPTKKIPKEPKPRYPTIRPPDEVDNDSFDSISLHDPIERDVISDPSDPSTISSELSLWFESF